MPLGRSDEIGDRELEVVKQPLGNRQEARAFGGQGHAPRGPVEQFEAQSRLELLNRRRERGLGQMHPVRRNREACVTRHRNEAAQMLERDIYLHIRIINQNYAFAG